MLKYLNKFINKKNNFMLIFYILCKIFFPLKYIVHIYIYIINVLKKLLYIIYTYIKKQFIFLYYK